MGTCLSHRAVGGGQARQVSRAHFKRCSAILRCLVPTSGPGLNWHRSMLHEGRAGRQEEGFEMEENHGLSFQADVWKAHPFREGMKFPPTQVTSSRNSPKNASPQLSCCVFLCCVGFPPTPGLLRGSGVQGQSREGKGPLSPTGDIMRGFSPPWGAAPLGNLQGKWQGPRRCRCPARRRCGIGAHSVWG